VLYIAGSGPLAPELKNSIVEKKMPSKCILLGRIENVMDYLAAADFLIHPSISESSCVVVKEAALVGTPVIYCEGIGDCDEYIENEVNGFLVGREQFVTETAEILQRTHDGKIQPRIVGQRLRQTITDRFSIASNIALYEEYI
jgi:glycosyltransferase involved in cell wall biosynthesis